jgi:hypothetical protein
MSSIMDLIVDLALRVVEGGWVMGTELRLVDVFRLGHPIGRRGQVG